MALSSFGNAFQYKESITSSTRFDIWPNVYTTVSELQESSFARIIDSLGGFVLIGFGFLAMSSVVLSQKNASKGLTCLVVLLWLAGMVYASTKGVRFMLLAVVPIALGFGLFTGKLMEFAKGKMYYIFTCTIVIGAFGMIMLTHQVQGAYDILRSYEPPVDDAWWSVLETVKQSSLQDAIITTWWDPGHIIAGYTGLKVHADGGHCDPRYCIPYNHNIRIRDMGKIFSTSDEGEAVSILKKYKELTPSQCERGKAAFGGIFPTDACKPVTDIYLIASSDLIGKYLPPG